MNPCTENPDPTAWVKRKCVFIGCASAAKYIVIVSSQNTSSFYQGLKVALKMHY